MMVVFPDPRNPEKTVVGMAVLLGMYAPQCTKGVCIRKGAGESVGWI
jgi:hypothetical protein